MDTFQKLMSLLDRLDGASISYSLNRVREESMMVQVSAPGERWEIEVMGDGSIEVEIFRSDGRIFDEEKISDLFGYFAERLATASTGCDSEKMA